jgi:hypothetical protein
MWEYETYCQSAAKANLTVEEYINKAIVDGLKASAESSVEDYGL